MTTIEARKQAIAISRKLKARVAVNAKDGNHYLYLCGRYQGSMPGLVGGHTERDKCPSVRVLQSGY